MKAIYKTKNDRLTFEFEGHTHKEIVTILEGIQEVFDESECGCCKSTKIRFDVREFDGNKYYKLLCEACGATLDFGQHKTGDSLFAKRFVKDTREPMPNRGWYKYLGGDEGQHAPPTAAPSGPPRQQTPAKPASAPPVPAKATPTPAPAQKPGARVQHRPQTIDDVHKLVLAEYREAKTEARVEAIKKHAAKHDFAQHHHDEQSDAYYAALDRINPIPVGAGVDVTIPF